MGAKFLDQKTGVILEEPEFVKLYIRDLCRVKGLSATQYKIFTFMLANMNTDNVVSFGPRTKEKFLSEHSIKPQTFNNNVSQLIESCLISRIARNEFLVNKKYAVKVDWAKVQKILWTTTYSNEGIDSTVTIAPKKTD
ncbi:TPA: replication/maintenance protein RepL [Escherichia coli]